MSLLPKEHGAYGQLAFPLIAALGVAGVSPGSLLLTAAAIAGFLAHEPALILLGLRGARAKQELSARATWWLRCCVAAATASAAGALFAIDPASYWSLAVPLVPGAVLAGAIVRGREKSSLAEAAAALAFAGAAVPVSMAAGAPPSTAAAIAVPFALLFVASTLAVRVVILRVRGGGDPRASAFTRRAALSVAAAGGLLVVLTTAAGLTPPSVIAAAAPGLITAAVVATHPPAPGRLRTLGWTLVAVSAVTTVIVVSMT